MNAKSWEVRRTAAFLLREFGGAEGLKELVPLLADAEPLVQREAVQGLMMNGSKEAAVDPAQRARAPRRAGRADTLLSEVAEDARSACRRRSSAISCGRWTGGKFPRLYVTAIEALGAFGGAEAIDALKVRAARRASGGRR